MGNKEETLLALGGVVGAVGITYYLYKKGYIPSPKAKGSPTGTASISTQSTGSTVTVTVDAKATGGTTPINVSVRTVVVDQSTETTILDKTQTGTVYDLSSPTVTFINQFTGAAGHTYSISATATFSNSAGSSTASANKTITIPGIKPTGTVSIEATIS